MTQMTLRPALPERDFAQLAAWYALLEEDAPSEERLREYHRQQGDAGIQRVAEDERQEPLGFYWIYFDSAASCSFELLVAPGKRGQGIGALLYDDLERSARDAQVKSISVKIMDTNAESRRFAEKRGFTERWHFLPMRLDLGSFDDSRYDPLISRLEKEGFRFTSMEALGDTEAAQRQLYALNSQSGLDIPGKDGESNWDSFHDFQKRVCQVDWYKPGGQKIAIDAATGTWAAMSAITRFQNHAYNLYTGVDRRYRGRKLAQAVKVTALRYARDVLKVKMVHTDHSTMNLPIIAIDRKFGYVEAPGTFVMRKALEE